MATSLRDVRSGSFSTEVADSAARPTSASPRKLTGPNEKLVAMGHCQTSATRVWGTLIVDDFPITNNIAAWRLRSSLHAVGGIEMIYRAVLVEFPNEPVID
jgi:hypothetical protein